MYSNNPDSSTPFTVINDKLIAECIQLKPNQEEEEKKPSFGSHRHASSHLGSGLISSNTNSEPKEIPEFHQIENLVFSFKSLFYLFF